jgi:hypothetical protein
MKLQTLLTVALLSVGAGAQEVNSNNAVSNKLDSDISVMDGQTIVANVNNRDDGQQVTRSFRIALTDRRGVTRIEETKGFRKYYDDQKKTVIFYTDPTNVRGTAFLTFDYFDEAKEDDQWLYLPALRRVRRISASDRGDYFLGTDLTYEEIKKEGKYDLSEYNTEFLGSVEEEGRTLLKVKLTPKTDTLQAELGYSRLITYIDPDIWISRKIEYWDTNGNSLKTINNTHIKQINGYWTVTEIAVKNHKTKHSTKMTFFNIDYKTAIRDNMFTQQQLRRGLQ